VTGPPEASPLKENDEDAISLREEKREMDDKFDDGGQKRPPQERVKGKKTQAKKIVPAVLPTLHPRPPHDRAIQQTSGNLGEGRFRERTETEKEGMVQGVQAKGLAEILRGNNCKRHRHGPARD